MRNLWALATLFRLAVARERAFSVHNDLLAFPQYEIIISDTYVTAAAEEMILQAARNPPNNNSPIADSDPPHDLQKHHDSQSEEQQDDSQDSSSPPGETYEQIQLGSTRYLCTIPLAKPPVEKSSEPEQSAEERQRELIRASDRGWELLKGLQDNCLYYHGGWWVYSFCYNDNIKQFHPLPPGRPGVPIYPPVEDKSIQSYILGRFDSDAEGQKGKDKKGTGVAADGQADVEPSTEQSKTKGDDHGDPDANIPKAGTDASHETDIGPPRNQDSQRPQQKQLQTANSQSYLVRHLSGGTICDLTERPRRIEVQFHCDPTSTDHISMIKETASCVYLMVVRTPRLCNDVAFLPPTLERPEAIVCREVVDGPASEAEWKARKTREAEALLRGVSDGDAGDLQAAVAAALQEQQAQLPHDNQQQQQQQQRGDERLVIGGWEVGAQTLVGGAPERSIKASNIIAKTAAQQGAGSTKGEKFIATLAKSDGRSVTTMSERQLREKGLDDRISRADMEDWVREMDDLAKGHGWEINIVRTAQGLQLRRVIVETEAADHKEGDADEGGRDENAETTKGGKKHKKNTRAKETDGVGSEEEL